VLWQSSKGQDRLVVDCRDHDALWAVFDGHRFSDVAGHASQIFPGLLWSSPLWPAWPGEALSSSLRECHESARREGLQGGSTAVVVAATGGLLWCSSAGDSRAVVGLRCGGVRRLSVDHTMQVPEEVARVRTAGGSVEWGRLGGCLPMTRGLGNFSLESEGFACLPDVGAVPLREADFLIVASDGLWDVIEDEKCCAVVREWGRTAASSGKTAEYLARHARALGSCDDIAIVVAYFPFDTDFLQPDGLIAGATAGA